MKKKYLLILFCCLFVVGAGCNMAWIGTRERRDLEIAMYFEFRKANVESLAFLDTLIAKGEIENARKYLQMRIFLDLHELDQLADPQFQTMLGGVPLPFEQEELKAEVSKTLADYYTQDVRDAGRVYASVPSDIKYIEESREFLEKMKRLGLPKESKSDGQSLKGNGLEGSSGAPAEMKGD